MDNENSSNNSTFVVPSNPEDRRELAKGLQEAVDAMTRMDAERDKTNEVLKELENKFDIPKKILRQVAKTRKDSSYPEKSQELSSFEELYENLFKEEN